MAKQAKQTTAVAAQPIPTEQATPQVAETVRPTEGGQANDELKAPRLPDVREIKSVNLGPDRDSPRLRLLRSFRFNQMQIRSDEALPEAASEKLKAEGWRDRTEEEGIWTKQLPPRRALTRRRTLSRRHPPGRWSLTPSACFTRSPTPSGPTGD